MYSIPINQVMMATGKLSNDGFNLITSSYWFSSFLVKKNTRDTNPI